MRAATVLADKGDIDGAVKDFDEVAADNADARRRIRDMARLRAGTPAGRQWLLRRRRQRASRR